MSTKKTSKALAPSKGVKEIKTIVDLENLGPGPVDRFSLVNEYHTHARLSMAQSCAYMILAGVELLALKKDAEHGTWETLFPVRNNAKSGNVSTFAFSYDSARNYMRLAEAAKKHIPALKAACKDSTPLSLMEPAQRDAVIAVVKKAGDGSTYKDLALEWGLAKKPSGNGGGSQTANEGDEKLTPAQIAERAAQELFHDISLKLFRARSDGEKQKLLMLPISTDKPGDVTGLADLRDHTAAFLALVDEVLEEKKKSARKAK